MINILFNIVFLQSGKIHATIRKHLVDRFKNVLLEGSCYINENLLVS